MDDIALFLRNLTGRLPLIDAESAGRDLYGAPRFSAFALFAPNEPTLSRVLADLLNPRGSHGQGPLFLNSFFRALEMPGLSIGSGARVSCEVATHEGRRIDILIETRDAIVAIENKPFARQQDNQLQDYLAFTRSRARGRKAVLVFLSDQTEESARGDVMKMSFWGSFEPSLSQVLNDVYSRIKAPKTRWLIDDFLGWLERREAMMGMEFYGEGVLSILEAEPQHKRSVAAVLLASREFHAQMIEEAGVFLHRRLQEADSAFLVHEQGRTLSQSLAVMYKPWGFRKNTWPNNCFVGLSAEKEGFRGIIFGVYAPDSARISGDDRSIGCDHRADLDKLMTLVSGGKSSAKWPWYRFIQRDLWTIDGMARAILESPSGAIAEHPDFIDFADHIVHIAKQADEVLSSVENQ